MLHWGRAFDAYNKGGFKSNGPAEEEGSIACEIYVLGKSEKWIDYVVLMGETKKVWDATFPANK